ncbi:MAG TPA: glycine/betaine ABC transporter substrate-binding protein [Syntrophomonadaceae bacterium]|nr:glycine/betaine ABC transporter substrate-binding protein [Syntrophomonadaceae bacterium]
MKDLFKWISICMLCVFLVVGAGCGKSDQEQLVIASQNFAEPQILSEMVKQLLEANMDNIVIEHKRNFQGSSAVQQAFETGDVHIYNSYTGTQFTGVLGMEVTEEWKDREKVYQYVKDKYHEKYGIKVFEPYGFNDTYCIAVRRDTAEKLNLKKISDLVPHAAELQVATDPTFKERKGDGWNELIETYGLDFKEVPGMSYDLMYQALKNKEVDAAAAYTTDGRIAAYDLVVLEDDKNFFPPYDGVLFIREDTLEKYPEIEDIVSPLIGAIDEETICKLNAKVDVEKKEPADVANEYLKEQGLI